MTTAHERCTAMRGRSWRAIGRGAHSGKRFRKSNDYFETAPGAPYKARLRNIERIEKKLEEGARQTSGNAFGAGFGSTLNAIGIHRPVGRSAYVVLAEIPQPWRDQFQEVLRGSACPVVEPMHTTGNLGCGASGTAGRGRDD